MTTRARRGIERLASAGRRGADVRSDLWVQIEPRDRDGIDLELRSRVEPYYGDAIRAQVRDLCGRLGVLHARLEVEDSGALPFTIAARVECAVRRAGGRGAEALPEPSAAARPPNPRDRLRRSRLYLPGNEPKFMVNALLHGADCIILDLEDAVHPSEKDAARLLVRNALRTLDFGAAERMVRINPLPLGSEDLQAVVPQSPDVVLLPKCESAAQVREVESEIARIRDGAERAAGSTARATRTAPIWLLPIVESALGVVRAFEIASASPLVVGLTIGLEDYTADLGVARTAEGRESFFARTTVVNAAKAAGVQAIDKIGRAHV